MERRESSHEGKAALNTALVSCSDMSLQGDHKAAWDAVGTALQHCPGTEQQIRPLCCGSAAEQTSQPPSELPAAKQRHNALLEQARRWGSVCKSSMH